MRCAIADTAQQIIQPALVGFGKIMQHIARDPVLVARMPDAKADPGVSVTNMLVKRAQPIVASVTSAGFEPAFAGYQVQLIMENNDIRRGEFVKPHCLANGLAREVHESLGFEQNGFLRSQPAFADKRLKLAAPRGEPMCIGNLIQRHETDVVAVHLIFRTWIAKADKKFHCEFRPLGNFSGLIVFRVPQSCNEKWLCEWNRTVPRFEVNGVKLRIASRHLTPKVEAALSRGGYENAEASAVKAHLTSRDRVLEIGTGVGYVTVLAARMVGPENTVTVEANPDLIPDIEKSLELNGVQGVEVINRAVVAEGNVREVSFFVGPAFWAASLEQGGRRHARKLSVPAVAFDELIRDTSPTVLICDAEGAENRFFRAPLPQDLRLIVLELHPRTYDIGGIKDIFDRLSARGFGYSPRGSKGDVVCFEKVPLK